MYVLWTRDEGRGIAEVLTKLYMQVNMLKALLDWL